MRTGLTLLCLVAAFVIIDASCPYAKPAKSADSHKPRGHNRPFGHHAKNWKRIETVYEHPDPITFYNNYVRTSKPLFIKGGISSWPAIKKWTNISYVNEFGGKERSHVNWKKMYSYDRHHAIRIDMTMKEFTDKFDTHDLYMDATIPVGLHDDVHWPHSLGCQFFLKRMKQLAIMMNNGRSRSDVHIDVTDTYFMQATGKRLWLLSPPSNVTSIYSGHPNLVDHSGISILNQTHMDLEKHAEASKLEIYAAYLEPGDIVYVPEAWYHQVVTYDSPNIAIVAFMNVLFCEYETEGINDIYHVSQCVNKVLQNKPRKLDCNPFPREDITITQLLKRYNPRTKGAFQGYSGTSPTIGRYRKYGKRLPDGTILPAIGMAVDGMSEEALKKGRVLIQGLVEGYMLYTTAPGDGSEEAMGALLKKYKSPRRARLQHLSYLTVKRAQEVGVAKSIESTLKTLNLKSLNYVLLMAPYCIPDYKLGTCTRNDYQQSWTDAWKELEKLVEAGKIKYIGVSDFSLEELKQLEKIAKKPITFARARFDIYFRNLQFRHHCKKQGIHFMARSVLGKRWAEEQPNYPINRDIIKEYKIQKAAYQYKISVHAAVYDWAVKKHAIVTPSVNDPLYVRVNIKSLDSESSDNPMNIEEIDRLDSSDKDGLWTPYASNSQRRVGDNEPDSSQVGTEEEEEGGEGDEGPEETMEPAQTTTDSGESKPEKDRRLVIDGVGDKYKGNFSDKTYTDEIDYENFPAYMLGGDKDD